MRRLKVILLAIMTFAFVLYFTGGLILYLKQRDIMYHPTSHIATSYKTETLDNQGESIGLIILNEGHQHAILYFGGNGESMVGSAEYIANQFPNFTVYLMDYRGYGASSGMPTEQGIYSDALALYDKAKIKHSTISVGGRSLGSGVATYVASNRNVHKLVLVTPFDSIVNVAKSRYPIYPIRLLIKDRYDSASRANKIDADTLIVVASNDQVVPVANTQNLIESFNPEKLKVVIIQNRGHNDISEDPRYYRVVQEFIGY